MLIYKEFCQNLPTKPDQSKSDFCAPRAGRSRNLKWRFTFPVSINRSRRPVMPNPKSTAQIAGHPLHPMLIPFPIAFFVATFVCDLLFWGTGNPAWPTAALWLLGAGLIMAALAAVAGLTDFLGEKKIRSLSTAWWHAGGNVLVVLIELYN